MEPSLEEQIFNQLGRAKKILIALPQNPSADGVASGLAFKLFLEKLEKDVEIVSSGPIPKSLSFLPGVEAITEGPKGGKSLAVILDTSVKKLESISYQEQPDRVSIFLKPKTGVFVPEDITFQSERLPIDVIVILEARSLDDLGLLFEQNPDLFFETPKINIDNKPGNEYFGSINMVDVTASSIAEILSSLFEKYEEQLVDEVIATCLLTGIITKTNSFQHVQTTPNTFLKASQLVALGGRQQEIVRHVYKTKSLPFLKLWGRALARVSQKESPPVIYSILTLADFEKSDATLQELPAVLMELVNTVAVYEVVAVIGEGENETRLLAAVSHSRDLQKFLQQLKPTANKSLSDLGLYKLVEVSFANIPLKEVETRFLQAIKTL